MSSHGPVFRVMPYAFHRDQHAAELEFDILTEAGEPAVLPVTINQRSTKFFLQAADRAGQAWLGDTTKTSSCREIQRLGQVDEIADLIEFHSPSARAPDRCYR